MKLQHPKEKSVKIVTKEFLKKAACELLGNNNGGIQGHLDDDELPVH